VYTVGSTGVPPNALVWFALSFGHRFSFRFRAWALNFLALLLAEDGIEPSIISPPGQRAAAPE
jgi:hypothetical protein